MKAAEKNAARHKLEATIDKTVLGSNEWWEAIQDLRRFDSEHPNLWADDQEGD